MTFLVKILISSLAVMVTALLLPGIRVENYLIALLVALVLAVLNASLKPLLIIFTIPVTVITLGLFLIVINAIVVITADWLVDGFEVRGFLWAVIFSLVLSVVTSIFEGINRKDKEA